MRMVWNRSIKYILSDVKWRSKICAAMVGSKMGFLLVSANLRRAGLCFVDYTKKFYSTHNIRDSG